MTFPVVAHQPSTPVIVEPPANTITTDVATPINLTCTATGNPPPTYQWLKDGVPIPQETRSYLYIAKTSPEKRGNYTCVASNSRGNVSEQANVDIQGEFVYGLRNVGYRQFLKNLDMCVQQMHAIKYQHNRFSLCVHFKTIMCSYW